MSLKSDIEVLVTQAKVSMESLKGKSLTLQQMGDVLSNLQKCTTILKDLDQIPDAIVTNKAAEKADINKLLSAAKGK